MYGHIHIHIYSRYTHVYVSISLPASVVVNMMGCRYIHMFMDLSLLFPSLLYTCIHIYIYLYMSVCEYDIYTYICKYAHKLLQMRKFIQTYVHGALGFQVVASKAISIRAGSTLGEPCCHPYG